jgi:hypothetical protein
MGIKSKFVRQLVFFSCTLVLLALKFAIAADHSPDYFYPDSNISTNGIVRVVYFYERTLYVGGNFTKVTDEKGTYSRTDLAAFDVATGHVTNFKANTTSGMVRAIIAAEGKLFVGGTFTKINKTSCSKVAALNPITGDVLSGFRENSGTIEGAVWALAVAEKNLFLGGKFTSVDGTKRTNLAAVDTDSGSLITSFDPECAGSINDSGKTDTGVYALKVHPNNPKIVFASGNYLTIAGKTDRKFLTVFNSDGTLGPEFRTALSNPIMDLDASDSVLYAGVGGSGNKIVTYDIGAAPYTRIWGGMRVQGDVQAVAFAAPGYVYFGFHDGCLDTADSFRLAVLNAKTGDLYDAYPPMNSFFGVRALDFEYNCLAVGGEFTQMNGRSQKYLAVFRTFPLSGTGPLRPATPVLVTPVNGETGVAVDPVLHWNYASHAVAYEIQVAPNPQFSELAVNKQGVADFYQWCSGLISATSYWWRVRASNSAGASDWSIVWNFSMAPDLSNVPAISYPADGADSQTLTVDLCWFPAPCALSYGLQVSEQEDFSTTIIDRLGINDTSFLLSGLANLRYYYWRVNAQTVGGATDWANAWFRTNIAAPKSPRCVSPGNNASKIVRETALRWDPVTGAAAYGVQVSTDRSFQTVTYSAWDLIDTAVSVTGLVDDTRYFWRVFAANAGGLVCSPAMQFTTIFPLPVAPRPVFPEPGHLARSDSLCFIWNASKPHVTGYWLEIARDSTMQGAFVDSMAADTTLVRTRLVDNKEYWWRVRAANETGWSPYSEMRLFKTAFPVAPVKKFSFDNFAFHGNVGSIEYSIARQCAVRLTMVDLQGKTLWRVVKNKSVPGSYREQAPASRLPVGAYFVSLKAGPFTQAVKASLVK